MQLHTYYCTHFSLKYFPIFLPSVPLTVKADSNGYFCHGPPNFEETGTVSDDWKVLLDMDGYSLVYYIVYT